MLMLSQPRCLIELFSRLGRLSAFSAALGTSAAVAAARVDHDTKAGWLALGLGLAGGKPAAVTRKLAT
jgi:hypothetical protein